MASNNAIGSTSLLLSADAAQLNQGLSQAQRNISAFVTNINSKMQYVGTGIKGFIVGIAIQASQKLVSLFNQLREGVTTIANEAKISERLGIPFERFSGLMGATKLNAEQLSAAMQNVANQTARAALEQARTGNASGRSGRVFQQLGLDPNQLRQQDSTAQFESIGRAIAGIQNPIEQTRLATQLFGESGAQVAQAFRGDFDKAMQTARDLGLVISNEDAQAAKDAQKTFGDTARIVQGLFRQLSVAVAPAIGAWNQAFQAFWTMVSPIVRNITDLIRAFSIACVAIKDELVATFNESGLKEFWNQWAIDIPFARDLMIVFARSVSETVGAMVDWLVNAYADVLEYFFAPMVFQWAELQKMLAGWIRDFNTIFIQPFIEGIRTIILALARMADSNRATRGQVRGLLDTAAQLGVLREIPNGIAAAGEAAAEAGQAAYQNLLDAGQAARQFAGSESAVSRFFDGVERRARQAGTRIGQNIADGIDPILLQRAQMLHDKFKSPTETLDRSIADLSELFDRGLISEIELARGVEDAMKAAEQGLHIGPAKFASAALAGSKEAVTQIYHRDFDREPTQEERMRIIAERSLQVQEIQARNSQTMIQLLQDRDSIGWEYF